MAVYTITVAFCPASQLARSLIHRSRFSSSTNHVVVQGHYPINRTKNNRDIEMICKEVGVHLLDPGRDLGSAQSQWWALQQLNLKDEDYWINWDPDSGLMWNARGWDFAMESVLDNIAECIVISCMSPMVESFIKERGVALHEATLGPFLSNKPIRLGIAKSPIPFNLSMWRYSFFRALGGIPQLGEMWGEVEGPTFAHAQTQGKFHAYLLDYMEDESAKLMQDRQLLEFKDKNMRTDGPERFVGLYREYLAWKYPHLTTVDTFIDEGTVFR